MRSAQSKYDFRIAQAAEGRKHHAREAVRLRYLVRTVTTPAAKARVLAQVQEHERLAGIVVDGETIKVQTPPASLGLQIIEPIFRRGVCRWSINCGLFVVARLPQVLGYAAPRNRP